MEHTETGRLWPAWGRPQRPGCVPARDAQGGYSDPVDLYLWAPTFLVHSLRHSGGLSVSVDVIARAVRDQVAVSGGSW